MKYLIGILLIGLFSNVVYSQLKRGEFGDQTASEDVLQQLDIENGGQDAFQIIISLKPGGSFGLRSIALRAIPISRWKKYNTKEYIYVINDEPQKDPRNKKIIDVYPIWIYKLNENPIGIKQLDNKTIKDNSLGTAGNKKDGAYVFTLRQYQQLLKSADVLKNPDSEMVMGQQSFKQIPPEKLDISKTLNAAALTGINSVEEVFDFDALKKDPSSEIKRLDLEIKNQEEKITVLEQNLNQSLIAPYNELKSSLDKVNSRIQKLNGLLSDRNGLKASIEAYNLSEIDLANYKTLESQILLTYKRDDKKVTGFIEKLRKSYYIKNQILFAENQIYEYTEGLRILSLKLIEVNEKDLKKYKKLQSSQNFNVVEEQESTIKKLTGIDSKYFDYIDQLQSIEFAITDNEDDYLALKLNYNDLKESYNRIFNEKRNELKIVNDYKYELIKSKRAYIGKEKYLIAKKKYPTVKCGPVMISKIFLREKKFRSGEALKKARTQTEWESFCKSKTPCYAHEDFDDSQDAVIYYNLYALEDSRRITPYGYRVLEIRDLINGSPNGDKISGRYASRGDGYVRDYDYNHLKNLDFSEKNIVQCEKFEKETKRCNQCYSWTAAQKKYNVCSKCNGREYYKTGKMIKCSGCDGKGFYTYPSGISFTAPLMESKENIAVPSDKQVDPKYADPAESIAILEYQAGRFDYLRIQGFSESNEYSRWDKFDKWQVLICEDNSKLPNANNRKLTIGKVEFMPKLLDVVKFNNGDVIQRIDDPVEWEIALRDNIPAYCYFNNDTSSYGCIYNIHAWNDSRGIIPRGWRSSEYWDKISFGKGSETYRPVQELTLPRINFNEYPQLYPLGLRTDQGSFISNTTITKTKQIYESDGTVKGWKYRKFLIPHFNFCTYVRDDLLGKFSFYWNTNVDLDSYYPRHRSGYVLLVRDVEE